MKVSLSALVLALTMSAPALALDYRSVAENAVLYDAPSLKGAKLFIIARGTPVEVVLTNQSPARPKSDSASTGAEPAQDNWTKVRDGGGNMAWIEARLLSTIRTVQVRADKADVRSEANDKSAIVFSAEKNVVLNLLETAPGNPTPGWARVKHRDGQTGFVRASQIWGL